MKLLNKPKFKVGDVLEHVSHPWRRTVLSVGCAYGIDGYYFLKMESRECHFPTDYIDENYRKVEQ